MTTATTTKKFHIGDVLSVTTGRLVSPRHIDGVYDILNFMTGDNLFTHQLPRASDECKLVLLAQHPQLRDVDAASINKDNWKDWLALQVARFGEELDIKPVAAGQHQFRNPIEEAVEMMGDPRKVVVITK